MYYTHIRENSKAERTKSHNISTLTPSLMDTYIFIHVLIVYFPLECFLPENQDFAWLVLQQYCCLKKCPAHSRYSLICRINK